MTYDELVLMMQRVFRSSLSPDDELTLKYKVKTKKYFISITVKDFVISLYQVNFFNKILISDYWD